MTAWFSHGAEDQPVQFSMARLAAVAPESEKVSTMRMPLSLVPSMTTVEPARSAPARLSF